MECNSVEVTKNRVTKRIAVQVGTLSHRGHCCILHRITGASLPSRIKNGTANGIKIVTDPLGMRKWKAAS